MEDAMTTRTPSLAALALALSLSSAPLAALPVYSGARIAPAPAQPIFFDRQRTVLEPDLPVVVFEPVWPWPGALTYSYPAYAPVAVGYPVWWEDRRVRPVVVVPGRRYFPRGGARPFRRR
jgi:hypothetical protein